MCMWVNVCGIISAESHTRQQQQQEEEEEDIRGLRRTEMQSSLAVWLEFSMFEALHWKLDSFKAL